VVLSTLSHLSLKKRYMQITNTTKAFQGGPSVLWKCTGERNQRNYLELAYLPSASPPAWLAILAFLSQRKEPLRQTNANAIYSMNRSNSYKFPRHFSWSFSGLVRWVVESHKPESFMLCSMPLFLAASSTVSSRSFNTASSVSTTL
jgi:hypothetical protein